MRKFLVCLSLFAGFAGVATVALAGVSAAVFSQPAGQPAGKDDAEKKPAGKAPVPTAKSLVETLISRVDSSGYDDGNLTLGDVLEKLGKSHHVTFDVNERASKREGLPEVLKTTVATPPIPPMRTTFKRLLAHILDRVAVPSGATFLIREDCIEITTTELLMMEINIKRPAHAKPGPSGSGAAVGEKGLPRKEEEGDLWRNRLVLPVVSISVERQPLEEALQQMRLQANFNLVLDPGLGEKARTSVTTTMLNAPVDGALRVLTELAELDYVWLDNIFYITTHDKAQKLRTTWPDRRSSGGTPLITAATGPGAAGM